MNIIVTGASRGIGAETVLKLAGKGDHTIILISRNLHKLEELSRNVESINSKCRCLLFPLDLSSDEKIHQVCEKIGKEFNSIDILINNAGFLVNKSFMDYDMQEINMMLKVNFLAPVMLIRGLYPLLQKSEQAHVVNIGSMGGVQGSLKYPGLSFYSSTKGALAILTECLAEEYKNTGIKFNCLALGSADTEMSREAFPGYQPPLSAEEIAGFIADFALTANKFFNGKVIPVSLSNP